jgi:hypothetical protein
MVDENAFAILSSPTLQRQSLYHLQEYAKGSDVINRICEIRRLTTSLLLYWKALLSLSLQTTDSSAPIQLGSSVSVLLSVVNAILTKINMKCPSALHSNIDSKNPLIAGCDSTPLRHDTQSIIFWEALLNVAYMLQQFPSTYMPHTDLSFVELKELERNLETIIVDELNGISSSSKYMSNPSTTPSLAYRYALNRVQALMVTVLCRNNVQNHIDRARAVAFTIIGRLNVGEEYTALMLFGNHALFHPSKGPKSAPDPSPVSALLLQELFRTPKSRKQLDHSCKLNFTCRETKQACFDVQSLLPDTGESSVVSNGDMSDLLLPIGKYWLWKLLAGDTDGEKYPKENAESASLDVLLTSLELIDLMESSIATNCSNAEQLSDVAKLYYLTNICLKGEHILSHHQVISLADKLFTLYFHSDHWGDILELANECQSHLDPKVLSNSSNDTLPTDSANENSAVKAILDPDELNSFGWSKSYIRSIETYVGDLYDSYIDFGVQYDFFTKSIRLYLVKEFPTKIRLNLLNRFRNELHLLSLQDDEDSIIPLLSRFLLGGMPTFDQSARDDPELIDGITSLYCKGYIDRPDDKFVKLWAISVLARSLAISISTNNKSGLIVSKRRLCILDNLLAARVVNTVHLWLKTEGSLRSLIDSAIQSEMKCCPFEVDANDLSDTEWEQLLTDLNSTSGEKDQL